MGTKNEDLVSGSSKEMGGLPLIATCRLCLEKNSINMVPIFNAQLTISIADKIASVTRLNVHVGDGLPTMVCHCCLLQLDAANLFIERCISSDRSLRFIFTQDSVTRTMVCSEEVGPPSQPVTESDTQLVNSLALSPAGALPAETASVQGAELAQRFLEDYASLRFEMVEFEESSLLEDELMENNLTVENSVNGNIDSVSQMSVESLDIDLLHTDPLQISSKISFSHRNVSGMNGIRDNLHAICAIVALSNGDSLNVSNRAIKAEPTEPSTNMQSSESRDLPDCTMPVLEIQTSWLEATNPDGNIPTQFQDFPNLVAEIKAESQDLDTTTVAANIVQAPKSVGLANQKQSAPAPEKFKCPDCSNEYKNKRSLTQHTKLHEKHRKKILPQTSKRGKQLFKTKVTSESLGNLVNSNQIDVRNNPTFKKRSVLKKVVSPHIQPTELSSVQQSPLSAQLSQLKRVLVVKLNRLPANYLSLINPVTPSKTQKVTKKYKCAICLKEYKDKWYLASHIKDHETRTHPDQRPFKCKKCGNKFKNVPTLNAHIRQHNAERIYECELCKKLFLRMIHLRRHLMTHTKIRPYKCQTCGKGFKDAYILKTHLFTHTSEKPFKCEKCFRAFKRECQLKEHLRTHDQPQKPKLWHRCVVCLSDFLTEQRLQDHLKVHKDKDSQVTKSNEVQRSSDGIEAIAVERKFQNSSRTITKDTCDKTKVGKNSHQIGKRPKVESLHEAPTLIQTADDSHYCICKVCDLVCVNKSLLDHHSKIHTNRYLCIVCEKKFSSAKTLRAHKVIHRASRPVYSCETCCKTFSQSATLSRHKLMHTGEGTRYKCSICQRGFVLKSALGIHERKHFDIRPFKCNQCDRSYREPYSLKLHMRIHDQEKNYECSQCKMAFHRQSYLQRHMTVHETNRNKYSCDICDKSYFRRRSIADHMKKFHSTNK